MSDEFACFGFRAAAGVDGTHKHGDCAAVAVAGGMVVIGGRHPDELFDEASGRWFELPHAMAEPRASTQLVSVPATALAAAPEYARRSYRCP